MKIFKVPQIIDKFTGVKFNLIWTGDFFNFNCKMLKV